MTRFKDLSKLTKNEIDQKIDEIRMDIIKARVTAGKGGKVKIREIKKTLANLLMLKSKNKQTNNQNSKQIIKKS